MTHARFRGQPMLLLGVTLIGWGLVRGSIWDSPVPPFAIGPMQIVAERPMPTVRFRSRDRQPIRWAQQHEPVAFDSWRGSTQPRMGTRQRAARSRPPATAGFTDLRTATEQLPGAQFAALSAPRQSAAEDTGTSRRISTALVPMTPLPQLSGRQRWSGDAWVFWRDGSDAPLVPGQASYGRSQIGSVLRYRLQPGARHQGSLYLRAVAAVEGPIQRDVAVGASVRPLPGMPIVLAAEARASQTATGTEIRPAVFAYSQIAPLPLAGRVQSDGYVQAGYVGGDYETAFVDGQVRIDRSIAGGGEGFDLRAGLAGWGGAQKDASRLDVGPRIATTFGLGDGRGQLAADWRFRIAGDATPASGPAITFSTGF